MRIAAFWWSCGQVLYLDGPGVHEYTRRATRMGVSCRRAGPGWACCATIAASLLVATLEMGKVGAFTIPSFPASLRQHTLAARNCRHERTAGCLAMVAPGRQEVFDGTLQEGLERSAWEGKAPAIDKFNMQVVRAHSR